MRGKERERQREGKEGEGYREGGERSEEKGEKKKGISDRYLGLSWERGNRWAGRREGSRMRVKPQGPPDPLMPPPG